VFSLFQAPQIQQFKEAFQLIDHDKDGWINESDLREVFASLGEAASWLKGYVVLRTQQGYRRQSG
jgi:myosin regulatory light chain 12